MGQLELRSVEEENSFREVLFWCIYVYKFISKFNNHDGGFTL